MSKHILAILLCIMSLITLTSCKDNNSAEKENQLAAVREYATRYNFLAEAEAAVTDMAQVLAVYDSASYSRVRERMSGRMSTTIETLWFPYVNYPGAEIFQKQKTAQVVSLYVSTAGDDSQTFICATDVTFYDSSVRHYFHKATYNLDAKKITEFEEICSYA